MNFCLLGIVRFIYRAVGASILVRIGGDLYSCGGRGVRKLIEWILAQILAQCALYAKMADVVSLAYSVPRMHIAGHRINTKDYRPRLLGTQEIWR